MDFAAELQSSLKEFTVFGLLDVHENGGRVASFSGMSREVRGSGEKPLLHLWSEQLNLTRRVLAITDHSAQRLALAVERFGRASLAGWNSFGENSSGALINCPARNSERG